MECDIHTCMYVQGRISGEKMEGKASIACWGMWRIRVKEFAECILWRKAKRLAVLYLRFSIFWRFRVSHWHYSWKILVKAFLPLLVFVLRKCRKMSRNPGFCQS